MPKVKISEYSATANSNTDVASINIDEGCAPSGINNAIRAVMGHLKDFQQGTNGDPFNGPVNGTLGATTASTANVTTLTTSSTVTHNGGTANGVAYLNGSKVLTTGSALVFDGTKLGIGTASPSNPLHIVSNTVSQLNVAASSGNTNAQINLEPTGTGIALIGPANSVAFAFRTNATEAMRLDASGNLLVGTTTSRAPITIGKAAITANSGQLSLFSPTAADTATTGISITKYANDSTTSQIFAVFLINQATNGSGQINANGANAAAFGAFSDSRLKENIADLPSQLANIMALRPVEFDYIESEGGGHQIGFIAQEVQAIYPDLVGERKDGMLTLSDMNKNDARLIKAIQEQQVLITQLTARITALESA
jgi:hypothetical protein